MTDTQPTHTTDTDLLIIGGGINGAGIARDAQGRGLSVRLVEQNDFASATSSASSKLIHGGLRYLEYYEIRLVREALAERDVLLRIAPHLVKPMRFILPHRPHLRPSWMIRCGLFLYDRLAGRSILQGSKHLKFGPDAPLQTRLKRGFVYSDCWVDDARLVIHNLLDAQRLGAQLHNYTRCITAQWQEGLWHATLKPADQAPYPVRARVLINATGPWAQTFIEETLKHPSPRRVRLIKGSHLIVPRQFAGDEAYILQNEDKRIVFVIPYLHDFTLIGTTDQEYQGDPAHVKISQNEIDYLLKVYNQHFKAQLNPDDVISDYSGVRPLCDDESADPAAITRDYTLLLSKPTPAQGPLLNIYGGKLTTYRKLAEASLKTLTAYFPNMTRAWTANTPLPGSDISPKHLSQQLKTHYPWLPHALIHRWCISYGSLALSILHNTQSLEDLGQHFGQGLYAAEVDYLRQHEWAHHLADISMRRSKLGLLLNDRETDALNQYLTLTQQGGSG